MSSSPQVLTRSLLQEVFKNPRTMMAFEQVLQAAFVTNPGSIAVALNAPNFVAEFNGVGDSATNNDAAFTAAEASTFAEIYLPDGEFVSTLAQSFFTKHYTGPGKIILPTATMPGRFSYIATTPTLWPTQGQTGFFRGNTDHVEPEWIVIGPNTREYPTARYFECPFLPHSTFFDVKSGGSGWLTSAPGALAIGDASAVLTSTDGLVSGQVYSLTPYGMNGAITDTITIDSIVGTTITFHPALTTAYPNLQPDGVTPGRATLFKGKRTWNGVYWVKVTGSAAGDVYGSIWRGVQNYVPKAGQTHFFETSTFGMTGGDVTFGPGSSGTYSTGWEGIWTDNGEDVAVIFSVNTDIRTNDTGARSVVHLGDFYNSVGSKPSDAGWVLSGHWRVGLDTVRADLTNFLAPGDNLNAAINTSLGHRWIMNSTATAGGRGGSALYGPFYGNTPGDMFIESGTDGTSDYISMRFNRGAGANGRFRLRPDSFNTNVKILGGATIEAAAELVTGGTTPRVIWGAGNGVWISWNGTNLVATTDNGATFGILR